MNLTFLTLDPCRGVICKNYGECKPNSRSLLGYQCQCPRQCPPGVSKVCGSDGRSYSNECALKRESCQRKITITISYPGSCGQLKFDIVDQLIKYKIDLRDLSEINSGACGVSKLRGRSILCSSSSSYWYRIHLNRYQRKKTVQYWVQLSFLRISKSYDPSLMSGLCVSGLLFSNINNDWDSSCLSALFLYHFKQE